MFTLTCDIIHTLSRIGHAPTPPGVCEWKMFKKYWYLAWIIMQLLWAKDASLGAVVVFVATLCCSGCIFQGLGSSKTVVQREITDNTCTAYFAPVLDSRYESNSHLLVNIHSIRTP